MKFDPANIIDTHSWAEVQDVVRTCTEEEAKALLDYEASHKNRGQWKNRFHQRYNKLRGQREKRELAIL